MSKSPLSQPGQDGSSQAIQQANLHPMPASAAVKGPRALSPELTPAPTTRPTVGRSRLEIRHMLVIASFLLCVLLPSAIAGWYLWFRAHDQYASTVGFSVRREEGGTAIDLLGGLTQISGASSSDTDILYEFLQSQRLVSDLETKLSLSQIWSKPDHDPWFSYSGEAIEDLVAYWRQMVQISYEGGSGLIEVRVLAFDPADATLIARTLMEESAQMINELSAIAREDSIRYARADLDDATDHLREARLELTAFRNRTQIVDPRIDLQNQGGLLGTLQAQLAEALIEVDLLRDTARAEDPRMILAERRVEVIQTRIAAERDKLGLGSGASGTEGFPELVGEYERLSIEQEFAEQSYIAALTTYNGALAEARRTSRYLAAYAQPTQAESSRFPQRWTLLGIGMLFLFLTWTIVVLVAYALRDRR